MSPSVDGLADFNSNFFNNVNRIGDNKVPFQEQFVDINTLPVVICDLASEVVTDTNPWQATDTVWQNVHDIDYTKQISHTHNTMPMPFIHQDDSLDMKFVSVTPREVENNDVVVSECIIDKEEETKEFELLARPERRGGLLSVNTQIWQNNIDILNTPDVLSVVEQLEKEKCLSPSSVSIYFTNMGGGGSSITDFAEIYIT